MVSYRTEDAGCALRCRNIAVFDLKTQYVGPQRQTLHIEKCIIDVRILSIRVTAPMEFVQFGQFSPHFGGPYFMWHRFSGKAVFYRWYDGSAKEEGIMTVRFKYSVSSPIAHHHFSEILNLRIEFVEYILRYRGENVIMNVLCHIVDIWIMIDTKVGADWYTIISPI